MILLPIRISKAEYQTALAGPITLLTIEDRRFDPTGVWQVLEVGDCQSAVDAFNEARQKDVGRYVDIQSFIRHARRDSQAFTSSRTGSYGCNPKYTKYTDKNLTLLSKVRLTLKGSDEEKMATYKALRASVLASEKRHLAAVDEHRRAGDQRQREEIQKRERDRADAIRKKFLAAEEELRTHLPALADFIMSTPQWRMFHSQIFERAYPMYGFSWQQGRVN